MAKGRSPSEIKSRTVRINIGDWRLLMMMSKRADISMAEAFHLLITDQAKQAKPVTQPAFRVPVARVALRYASQPVLAIDGHKAGTLVIKPKGGIVQ
ncbi:unnamed protein product [marine sediment metagenome]|uniref:Uncharacterized protein n=1 Tax=marine sediment metagenome TaxID=412755 RepID=X1SBT4_9ZZZZ